MNQIVNERKIQVEEVALSLESLIREKVENAKKLKLAISEGNETVKNILGNDSTYRQHDESAKKATKVKNATKAEIMKRADVLQVVNKVKAAREEHKEVKQTISELLAEYVRTTGLDAMELNDGKVVKITSEYKLIQGNLF